MLLLTLSTKHMKYMNYLISTIHVIIQDVIGGKEELPVANRGIDECEIRLTPEQKAALEEDNNGKRKATSDLVKRWTDATVPYVIEAGTGEMKTV